MINGMPNTISELCGAVAICMREGDVLSLHEMRTHVEGWMQPEDQTQQQLDLIDATIETLETVEGLS